MAQGHRRAERIQFHGAIGILAEVNGQPPEVVDVPLHDSQTCRDDPQLLVQEADELVVGHGDSHSPPNHGQGRDGDRGARKHAAREVVILCVLAQVTAWSTAEGEGAEVHLKLSI
jgi:hypothetical protein